jgi:hypothetical protein
MLIVAERKNTGAIVIGVQREAVFDVLKVQAMGLMDGSTSDQGKSVSSELQPISVTSPLYCYEWSADR